MSLPSDYRFSTLLRKRMRQAILRDQRAGSAVRDLGAPIPAVKEHIESLFKPGMTWSNWGNGKGKWQLDHIMPLSAFDLSDRQHFVLAAHYLNLQPLWSSENHRKSDSLPKEIYEQTAA